MWSRSILMLVFAVSIATPQDSALPPPGSVIRIDVNLVQVDAVVTDSKGRHAPNLTTADFEILQDGKPQAISNLAYVFTSHAPQPAGPIVRSAKGAPAPPIPPPVALKSTDVQRTFAMVVDDLGLSFESVAHVRDALKTFVDRQMQPGDLVAIVRTSAGMGAFQQFTADKRLLQAAIDRIKFSMFSRVGVFSFAPAGGPDSDASALTGAPQRLNAATAIIPVPDLLDLARDDLLRVGTLGAVRYVVDGLSQLPGRKSVVLFSESMNLSNLPGTEEEILENMRHLIDSANRSSVVIYTVDPRGLQVFFPGAADSVRPGSVATLMQDRAGQMFDSQTGLAMLAQETGGMFIHDDNYVGDAIRQVVADSEGYYLIAYHPDAGTFESSTSQPKFHRLQVLVKPAGFHVRARSGFFGVTDSVRSAVPETREGQLQQALASPFQSGPIHVRLTTLFTSAPKQGPYLLAMLYVDARDLKFVDLPDGSHEARIDVLGMTFGDNGQVEQSANRSWSIQVDRADFSRLLEQGLICSIHHPLKKSGAYQMRVALRDSVSGQMGSASQFIEVPDVTRGRLAMSSIVLEEKAPATAPPTSNEGEGRVETENAAGSAAVRIFKPGALLDYEYMIFNAREDGQKLHKIEVQTRLFRDGKQVYIGNPMPLGNADVSDPMRVVAGGQLKLGAQIAPGDYVLQLNVTDKLAQGNSRATSQWIDFEVEGVANRP